MVLGDSRQPGRRTTRAAGDHRENLTCLRPCRSYNSRPRCFARMVGGEQTRVRDCAHLVDVRIIDRQALHCTEITAAIIQMALPPISPRTGMVEEVLTERV